MAQPFSSMEIRLSGPVVRTRARASWRMPKEIVLLGLHHAQTLTVVAGRGIGVEEHPIEGVAQAVPEGLKLRWQRGGGDQAD